MIYEVRSNPDLRVLFDGWDETMVWSCLQGVMGRMYVDSVSRPESAMAILGDFCFFAGKPNEELVSFKPERCRQDFMIMTAAQSEWFSLIKKVYADRAKKVSRYAIKKEKDIFDKDRLQAFADQIGNVYAFRMIDQELYEVCLQQGWSRDLVSVYRDYDEYQRLGIGVVALKDELPVCGASSYSSYDGGIEIEIDTKKEYRRKGLATACGAKLILKCLDRGLYPSWDAQNLWSVGLAEKLGYHFDREYTAYEISGY